jgi:hypothetical protein
LDRGRGVISHWLSVVSAIAREGVIARTVAGSSSPMSISRMSQDGERRPHHRNTSRWPTRTCDRCKYNQEDFIRGGITCKVGNQPVT